MNISIEDATIILFSEATIMEPIIAIVAAFDEEIKPLINRLVGLIIHRRHGFSFLQGYIDKKKVLLAISGMGRNKAQAMTETLVNNFPLSLIISTGIAGALKPHLQAGDIVLADRLFLAEPAKEENCMVSEINNNAVFIYKVPKKLIQLSLKTLETSMLRYNIGSFVTVDKVIGQTKAKRILGESLDCLAVEMESAAIATIAKQKGVPFLAVRSISDTLKDNIDKAIRLYENIKNDFGFWKRLLLLLRHPRESLELIKLRKNCSKATISIEKFILQLLNSPIH